MPTRDDTAVGSDELVLLWAARRTGVLDALLDTAGTPTAVAHETAVTRDAARLLVTALADRDFLCLVGDEYEPTNRLLGFLATRDVRSIGRRPHAVDLLERTLSIPETAHGEDPPVPDDWTRHRLGAHAATAEATVRACVSAAVRVAPDRGHVLDVGGGSGVYAREFVARGWDATLADTPARLSVVRPLLERTAVTLVETDLPGAGPSGADTALDGDPAVGSEGVDLGAPSDSVDLAFLVDVVRDYGPAANRALFEAVADSVVPGGAVVVIDAVRDRTPDASLRAALTALAAGRGDVYESSDVESWLSATGFDGVETRPIPGVDRVAVTGRLR